MHYKKTGFDVHDKGGSKYPPAGRPIAVVTFNMDTSQYMGHMVYVVSFARGHDEAQFITEITVSIWQGVLMGVKVMRISPDKPEGLKILFRIPSPDQLP